MYNYDPRPIEESDKERARKWYAEHTAHVDRLMQEEDENVPVGSRAYAPCGSDCLHPELWKPAHWRWLLNH